MTDKEKIRNKVERLKSQLIRGACSSQIAMETRCKDEAYDEVLAILDSFQEESVSDKLGGINNALNQDMAMWNKEEPVSEELGEYINELSKQFPEVSFAKLSRIAVRVAKWQKEQMKEVLQTEYEKGRYDALEEMKKEAVEVPVCMSEDMPAVAFGLPETDLKEGDTIKIIVWKNKR